MTVPSKGWLNSLFWSGPALVAGCDLLLPTRLESLPIVLILALSACASALAALFRARALETDKAFMRESPVEKEAALVAAAHVAFTGMFLFPRHFWGRPSKAAWSEFQREKDKSLSKLSIVGMDFPNYSLAIVLYLSIFIVMKDGYQGGAITGAFVESIPFPILVEMTFSVLFTWAASVLLFQAVLRSFLIRKHRS